MSEPRTLLPTVVMLIAGAGIPIMAALNAHLGARLGSPVTAMVVLCAVGLIGALVVFAVSVTLATSLPPRTAFLTVAPWYFAAGLLLVLYVLSVTWSAPQIGLGNAVFLVLLAQLVTAASIDHFGLMGATQSAITWQRALGLALMAAGVFLARKV